MTTNSNHLITIEASIHQSLEKVWELWTSTEHIIKWNHATDDWHTPSANNNFTNGGIFTFRMEAKDGSFGFDFGGVYNEIKPLSLISYTLGDGRKVNVNFSFNGTHTEINQDFEAENDNPIDLQKTGWQSILDNFKKYAEAN